MGVRQSEGDARHDDPSLHVARPSSLRAEEMPAAAALPRRPASRAGHRSTNRPMKGRHGRRSPARGLPRHGRANDRRRGDEHEFAADVHHRRTSVSTAPTTAARRGDNGRERSAHRNGRATILTGVYVDPKNPDIVYTVRTSQLPLARRRQNVRRVTSARRAATIRSRCGSTRPTAERQFLGVDQGATISLDGGNTWSSWYNQPTAQMYHISVDNSFPYWVYASQQDACAVAVRSRGELGAVTMLDWYPTPGYEFGTIVADPLNPKIVYGVRLDAGHREDHLPERPVRSMSAPNVGHVAGAQACRQPAAEWNADESARTAGRLSVPDGDDRRRCALEAPLSGPRYSQRRDAAANRRWNHRSGFPLRAWRQV